MCHKNIINNNSIVETSIEKNKEIEYDNEGYKEKLSELNKIYNLYKNEIYNEQEYKSKKEKWIESLELINFHNVETDFLNKILPLVKDNVLENRELETIKYIVSGEYVKDKYREEQEQKIKAEEEAFCPNCGKKSKDL